MNTTPSRLPVAGLISLGIVYVVWGSTYLAIRVAMREESGFTPFTLGVCRTVFSASVLLLLAYLKSRQRPFTLPSKRDAATLAVSGCALWIGGNAMVMIAERRVDSGVAALLVGTLPIWMTIVEAIWDRKIPPAKLIGAMGIGFAGLVVLTRPMLMHGTRADILSVVMLIIAPLSWGFGSVFQTKRPVKLSLMYSAGYQQFAAAVVFLLLALMFNEPFPSPTPVALAAGAYLAVMGGVVTFTAYLNALKRLPTPLVSTYAYVNPVIAVFLGCVLLGESFTLDNGIGTLLILLSIAGVLRTKR